MILKLQYSNNNIKLTVEGFHIFSLMLFHATNSLRIIMSHTIRKLQIIGNYDKQQHIQSKTQKKYKTITKHQPTLYLKQNSKNIHMWGWEEIS